MRPRLILVAGALNEREAPLIEDLLQPRQPRMQTERDAGRVAADLQHLSRRDRQRRPAAVVERIVVRNQHAERIVAAAQIQNDQIAAAGALRASQIGQKRRRRERDGERGNAALDELPSRDPHCSWYSGDPPIRWTSPGAFTWRCASLPVHALVAVR